MKSRFLAACLTALLVGCGHREAPVAQPTGALDAADIPPAQFRMMLEGLKSDDPRAQYGALNMLSNYPTVVQTYREQVEQLQKDGKDARVRKKAAELLASLEKTSAAK